jgi:hypothetical protein
LAANRGKPEGRDAKPRTCCRPRGQIVGAAVGRRNQTVAGRRRTLRLNERWGRGSRLPSPVACTSRKDNARGMNGMTLGGPASPGGVARTRFPRPSLVRTRPQPRVFEGASPDGQCHMGVTS